MGKKTLKIAGMILAAGFGKRMRSITSFIPKPLLPVLGVPMIAINAEKLSSAGASVLHVNIHHLADDIEKIVKKEKWPMTLHREKTLLDTGGGIGNMALSLGDEELILLTNSDILTNIPFQPAIRYHIERKALFTMILTGEDLSLPVSHRPPLHVHCGADRSVLSFAPLGPDESAPGGYFGYTGMSVISREAIGYFPHGEKTSLIEVLKTIIKEKPGAVAGFVVQEKSGFSWGETGTCSSYLDLHRRILIHRDLFSPLLKPPPLPLHAGRGSFIPPDTRWKGFLEIGQNVTIGKGCTLIDCVLLEDSVIGDGIKLERTIVFPGGEMKEQ
ncbi:MAG: NTP transferase domain-containing protein [Candidatus Krumholzibacteriota bacterium]|nr:NTP transferase domain-containing protein [Candidatus Krumholzibacteriota bacterium]